MKKRFIKALLDYTDGLFFTFGIFFSFASLIFVHLKNSKLGSIFFIASLFIIFLWFTTRVVYLFHKKSSLAEILKDKLRFFSLIALALFVVVSSLTSLFSFATSEVTFSLGKLNYLLILFSFCFNLYLTSYGCFTKNIYILPVAFSYFFSLLLLFSFISGFGRTWGGLHAFSFLTLNYSNPNLAAIIVSSLIFINSFSLFLFANKFFKISIVVLNISLFILLYLTSSRTPFVSLAFSVFVLVIIYFDKKKSLSSSISLFVVAVPLVFIFFYFLSLKFIYPDWNIAIESTINGKGIGSRFDIWVQRLSLICDSPSHFLFGNYAAETGNSHNSMITLMANYGLFGTLFFNFYLFLIVYKIVHKDAIFVSSQYFGISFFLFSLFLGIAEAAPIITSNGMFYIFGLGVLMVKCPVGKSVFHEQQNCRINKNSDKVLYLSNVYNYGSIGKIVRECHLNNLQNNFDSYVIYGRGKQVNDINAVSVENYLSLAVTKLVRKVFQSQSACAWIETFEIIKTIKTLRPKVIHIEAINDDYLNYKILFRYLRRTNIKIIYTHHSEYFYVGLCGGHANDCNLFSTSGCVSCPKYNKRMSKKSFEEKKDIILSMKPKQLITTSVSPWLHKRVKSSIIFRNVEDIIILNGSSIGGTEPKLTKKDLCEQLNLNETKKIVLHVTPSILNPWKKFNDFVKVARKNPQIQFVVLTLRGGKIDSLPNNITIVENICDESVLASYYKMADLLVLTGTKETFSMPVIESLLCGTPVLGYECGGPESIALQKFSSFVKNGDILDLDEKMKIMLRKNYDRNLIIQESLLAYASDVMAKKYQKLYNLHTFFEAEFYSIDI